MYWLYKRPWLAAGLVFGIDFLAMLIIRIFQGEDLHLTTWWSYTIGDGILLPAYAYSATKALQERYDNEKPSLLWLVFLFVLGFIFGTFLLGNGKLVMGGLLSENYHAVIYWFMFAIIGGPFPLVMKSPSKWKWVALACVFLFLLMVTIDFTIGNNRDTSPLINR